MKKQIGFWIVCVALFPALVFAADIDPEIQTHCDKIADHDLNVMQKCVEEQEKAKHWLESRRISDEVQLDCRVFSKVAWSIKKSCVEGKEKEMADTIYEGSFSNIPKRPE